MPGPVRWQGSFHEGWGGRGPYRVSAVRDLSSIVKAYDVRGVVPDQWDEDVARALGAAFAEFVTGESGATAVITAHDMRESSVPLSRAFAEGVISRGVDVIEAGAGLHPPPHFRPR